MLPPSAVGMSIARRLAWRVGYPPCLAEVHGRSLSSPGEAKDERRITIDQSGMLRRSSSMSMVCSPSRTEMARETRREANEKETRHAADTRQSESVRKGRTRASALSYISLIKLASSQKEMESTSAGQISMNAAESRRRTLSDVAGPSSLVHKKRVAASSCRPSCPSRTV